MALTSSLIVHQDAATQAAIRRALERRAAVYKTDKGLELPIAFRIGAGRKPGVDLGAITPPPAATRQAAHPTCGAAPPAPARKGWSAAADRGRGCE